MAKTLTWNGISSSTITGFTIENVLRQMLGEQRGVHVDIDGKAGTYHFPKKRGRRLIVAECRILVADMADRVDAVEEVADWLDVEDEAPLVMSDRPDRYWMATLGSIPSPREWRHLAKFDLEWTAQPYAFENTITTESFAAALDTTNTWNPDMSTNVFPVIEITPTNGTLSSFNVEHTGGNLNWATGTPIPSGDTVTVNSIAPIIERGPTTDTMLTGVYDPSQVDMAIFSGEFPILIPSASNFIRFDQIGGTATTFDIDVKYRRQFRR